MLEFDKKTVDQILIKLDDRLSLFPQFGLKKQNGELQILGRGGFSTVYEMYNKERPELSFAMKVIGFRRHTVTSSDFCRTSRIQWMLEQETKYIVRILETKELYVYCDASGEVTGVKDVVKESWEEEKGIHLQLVLMEKLNGLIEKDRFGNISLIHKDLENQTEIIKFFLEIGQAVNVLHNNHCLHRDIKLENIFWDNTACVYKLGDFDIAKYTEDDNAETIVYTSGYGAPEIEKRLYHTYNATADIYSFGITIYLLLNDLKFPASDGYYPKVEVQYNPEFVFPAPRHASEKMTRIIRKMCCYDSKDRYQSMDEVLSDLIEMMDSDDVESTDELAEIATQTFCEEKCETQDNENNNTREERKREQILIERMYMLKSLGYLLVLTILTVLMLKSMHTDKALYTNRMFFVIPGMVLFEAILQSIKEFHISFGIMLLVFVGRSIYSLGITLPHIISVLCVLAGCPVLSAAGAIAMGGWMMMEFLPEVAFFNDLSRWNLGWLFMIAVFFIIFKYYKMRHVYKKQQL